jgi:two-component system sensor histidine kinase KdpD
MRPFHKIWRSVVRTLPGCCLIGLITFICYRLQLNFSITGFVYLILIVLQSLVGSFASSAVVSVVAVLCLDFFFTPPVFSFEVTNPLDILALISFLTTGLVITRLTTRVRAVSQASAAAQAELFRGAILDALAHEFKTPLATIVTAAGGLRELGPLSPEQMELADIVEAEASRLGLLTSRLLRTAQIDRDEVQPKLEFTDLAELVTAVVDQYARQWADRELSVRKEASATGVMADPELLQLALRQLLDNACKYSVPGSAVRVSIDSQDEWVAIRTSNSGSLIQASERSHIFERFYRGTEVRLTAPGSGLGLYVARKIVHAHGGSLILETTPCQDTAFRLALPLAVRGA